MSNDKKEQEKNEVTQEELKPRLVCFTDNTSLIKRIARNLDSSNISKKDEKINKNEKETDKKE